MLRSLCAATLLATAFGGPPKTQFANNPVAIGSKIPSIELDYGFAGLPTGEKVRVTPTPSLYYFKVLDRNELRSYVSLTSPRFSL